MVTVEFYNHATETTQLAESMRPSYQTQFSFKNKVDSFYLVNLQRRTIKLDIYIAKNNAPIHLGTAQVYLRDLIDREVFDSSMRTPVVCRDAQVYPLHDRAILEGDQPN